MSKQINSAFWLVLTITVLIMFFNLGGIPLLDPDEPVYAETPKEMLQFQDLVSPRIYGEYWYDKPPIYYWLVAGAFKLFGVNEFAARLPSALLAVVCVMLIYRSGSRFFGERAGVVGALALATSIEYFYLAKAAVTDITLTLFLTASLLSFVERRYYLFYLFAGLATLTKGPIGLLFPGAIVFLYLAVIGRFHELKNMKLFSGTALYLIVAMPWYWIMYQLHGAAFIDTFIGFHNITRFTTAEHSKTAMWHFFIPVLILGFFPWTAIMAQSIRASLAQGRKDNPTLLFLNIWAAFIFGFFTLSSTKLVTYILPMYPPLAMIVGWYLGRCRDDYKRVSLSWPIMLTVLVLLLLGGMFWGVRTMPELGNGVMALAVIFIVMLAAVWFFVAKKKTAHAFWGQVAAMVLACIVLVTLLFPAVAPAFTTRDIAKDFSAYYDGNSPVYVMKFLHPGFTFYTDVYGIELKSGGELDKAIAEGGKAYFVIRESEYNSLSEKRRTALTVLASSGKKVLLVKH